MNYSKRSTRTCDICGKLTYNGNGPRINHDPCSKQRQAAYAGRTERKKPMAEFTERQINGILRRVGEA